MLSICTPRCLYVHIVFNIVFTYTLLSIHVCTHSWLLLSICTHRCLYVHKSDYSCLYIHTVVYLTHSLLLLSIRTHCCPYVHTADYCCLYVHTDVYMCYVLVVFFYQLNNHKLYTVVPLLWGTEQHNEGTILVSTQKISNHTTYSLARSKVDGRLIIRFTIFLYG